MLYRLISIFIISLLSGCSALLIELGQPEKYDASIIEVKDLRTEADHEAARDIRVSALALMEDFKPDILKVLSSAMVRMKPEKVNKIDLEIKNFAIYDNYPVRFDNGVRANMAGSLSTIGIYVVSYGTVSGKDQILCSLNAKLNGKNIQTQYKAPYGKLTTSLIRNDPALKSSILKCVNMLAKKSWEGIQ